MSLMKDDEEERNRSQVCVVKRQGVLSFPSLPLGEMLIFNWLLPAFRHVSVAVYCCRFHILGGEKLHESKVSCYLSPFW